MAILKKAVTIFTGIAVTLMVLAANVTLTKIVFQRWDGWSTLRAVPHDVSRQLRGTPKKEEVIVEILSDKNPPKVLEYLPNEKQPVTKYVKVATTSGPVPPDPVAVMQAELLSPQFWVGVAIQALFGYFYWQKVVQQIRHLPPQGSQPGAANQIDFRHGTFGCFEDTHTCLHGSCCYATRTAHSVDVLGIMDFWPAFVATLVSSFLTSCCVAQCLAMYFRMEIRKKLGIQDSMPMDCVCSFCCVCCSVIQQAREVDEKLGVKVECAFKLHQAEPPSAPSQAEMALS